MIQPFKNLTIVMAHKTNAGMIDGSHVAKTTEGGEATTTSSPKLKDLNIEAFRLKADLRFTPVVLKSDGLGYALAQVNDIHGGGAAAAPTGAVIGILLESFNKPMHEHEVMIHGVIGMKSGGSILPGNPVYWNETAKNVTATMPSEANKGIYYLGIALTQAPTDGDYVDVLIGK